MFHYRTNVESDRRTREMIMEMRLASDRHTKDIDRLIEEGRTEMRKSFQSQGIMMAQIFERVDKERG